MSLNQNNVIYSYNKNGDEDRIWNAELNQFKNTNIRFIPFNHGNFIDVNTILDAQRLDDLFYAKDEKLNILYDELKNKIIEYNCRAIVVDNCFPYHPDYLFDLNILKIMRSSDGPVCAYMRDFAYAHAYDLIAFHGPGYSEKFTMKEKLDYIGVKDTFFWRMGVFEEMCHDKIEDDFFESNRDIDIIFIGALHLDKMPFLAALNKRYGKRFAHFGLSTLKRNLYFNIVHGAKCWVRPVAVPEFKKLYRRSKIGINIHNRGLHTVGSYRLFDLPASGVMQISDGGDYLNEYFSVGDEIVGYSDLETLFKKIDYYLENENERIEIARAGYEKTIACHTMQKRLLELSNSITERLR